MFEAEFYPVLVPEDSYSRKLDKRAQADTPPYGYASQSYLPMVEIELEVPEKEKKGKKK